MFVPSIVTSINDVRLNLIALLSRLSLLMRFTSEFPVQLVIFLSNKNKKIYKNRTSPRSNRHRNQGISIVCLYKYLYAHLI